MLRKSMWKRWGFVGLVINGLLMGVFWGLNYQNKGILN